MIYMFVLGMGLGSVMQVLVLIVQNSVPYSELGVATAGATFFRSIGGSFGTAIFGAIFSNVLVGNLVKHLGTAKLPAGVASSSITPAILNKLPTAVHHGLAAAYAESIQTLFIIGEMCIRDSPKIAVPNEPPMDRKNVAPAVATPSSE